MCFHCYGSAPTQVEVFPGMWHDFIEETHGCGALCQPLESDST